MPPQMNIPRNILLSTVYFLANELSTAGWTNVTMVGELPEDNEVVFARDATGAANEVVIPAIHVSEMSSYSGDYAGIGENTRYQYCGIMVFLFAETPGQEMDLRNFIENTLSDKYCYYYNFADYGYPPTGTMTYSGLIEYGFIRGRRAYNHANVNAAARYGGIIMATAIMERQTL